MTKIKYKIKYYIFIMKKFSKYRYIPEWCNIYQKTDCNLVKTCFWITSYKLELDKSGDQLTYRAIPQLHSIQHL